MVFAPAGMSEHMEGLLQKLRSTEEALDERLAALEAELRDQLDSVHAEHAAAAKSWFLPFAGLLVALLVLCVWGVRQYRQVRSAYSCKSAQASFALVWRCAVLSR